MSRASLRALFILAVVVLGFVVSRLGFERPVVTRAARAEAAGVQYELVWIGDFGGLSSWALGLNDRGDVVGTGYAPDGRHCAFLDLADEHLGRRLLNLDDLYVEWRPSQLGGRWRELTNALSVSNERVIVGRGICTVMDDKRSGEWRLRSFRLQVDIDGSGRAVIVLFEDLGAFHGAEYISLALGSGDGAQVCINHVLRSGQISPFELMAHFDQHVAALAPDGTMLALGMLPGATGMRANAINARGQIVGGALDASGHDYRAWRYMPGESDNQPGVLEDLGTLRNLPWEASLAADISDAGHIVGYSTAEGGRRQAFVYTDEDGMTGLGTLGGDESFAEGVNIHGAVVGWSQTETGEKHGFVYFPGSGMHDLTWLIANEDDVELTARLRPRRINAAGQICGTIDAYSADGREVMGKPRAFLLNPLPVSAQTAQ